VKHAGRRISGEWRKKTLLESRISQAYKTNVCNYIKYISKLFKNFTQVALLQKRSVRIFASTYAAVQSARKNIAPFRVQRICSQVAMITISTQATFQLLMFTARVRLVRHNLKRCGSSWHVKFTTCRYHFVIMQDPHPNRIHFTPADHKLLSSDRTLNQISHCRHPVTVHSPTHTLSKSTNGCKVYYIQKVALLSLSPQ